MKKGYSALLGIFLPISILFICISLLAFNEKYYESKYLQYNIPNSTGLEINELMKLTNELFDYFKGHKGEKYLKRYFNERELAHISDVKLLFDKGFLIRDISMTLFLISFTYLYLIDFNILMKTLNYSICSSFLAMGILYLLLHLDFNKYFTYFHLALFNNDLWLLDPSTDIMIRIFPEEFFINIVKDIGLSFLIFMSIILISINSLKVRMKNKIG
ncbi:MAG: Integral membrane protein TIGR01906 [Sporanaerobacter sp.]|jgi:integral membrane protein (TIGR01906 family)|uniref:TIGR01906 family membrane protein n=1 Tax=Sporanaerobacter sp. TaxID=2010183 RepID=UPI003A100099